MSQAPNNQRKWSDYLLELQNKLEEANKGFTGEINEFNRASLNQLFVIAGGFITLASAILVTKEIREMLTVAWTRYTLFASIVAAFVSLSCGLAQFAIDLRYLRGLKSVNAYVIQRISKNEVKSPKELDWLLSGQDGVGSRSDNKLLVAQIVSLLISGVTLLAVIAYILSKAK